MIAHEVETYIPKAVDIDYSNVEEVEGYSIYLCKLYERAGGLNYPHKSTRETRALEAELSFWCKVVEELFETAPLCDIPTHLMSYDLPYRIVHQGPPPVSKMRKISLGAVQRWAKGDKSISTTRIAQLVSVDVHGDIKTLEKKYCMFYFGTIDDWVKELMRFGKFRNVPLSECFTRLRLLLSEELFGQYGSGDAASIAKRKWVDKYRVEDITLLDTPTLREYIGLAMADARLRHISLEDQETEYIRLFTELQSRPDLNPHHRQAITLDLMMKQERNF